VYCDYRIVTVTDSGNRVDVVATAYEGSYQDVDDGNGGTINQYVRLNKIGTISLMFERSPVTESEIKNELKKSLNKIKGEREVVTE
jgi:hypothetical protein